MDASGTGIGGVLSQMQDERERVISYASRAMNKAERNYCVTEGELLAVVYFMQYFRQYLLGRHFVVRTDHQALIWLFRLKEPNGKIARWIELLSPFDFEIQYRAGSKQSHCDALSRCESPRDCKCSDVDNTEPLKCGPCGKCRRRAETMVLQWRSRGNEQTTDVDTQEDELASSPDGEQSGGKRSNTPAVQELPVRALTRSSEKPSTSRGTDEPWIGGKSRDEMLTLQQKDPHIGPIAEAKLHGLKPTETEVKTGDPEYRHYVVIWDQLCLLDGLLYKEAVASKQEYQLVAPRSIRKEIMWHHHDSLTAGHFGVKRTRARIRARYYWYKMKQDVGLYVMGCDICEADKRPNKKMKAPMGHVQAGAPWDVVAIDFTGPFPVTERGNRYILVVTDHFSKYTEVIPVPNQTAEECATRLVHDVIARWGVPITIHSDQGSAFESQLFKELCTLFQMKKTRTSARHPRANGQVERFNRSLLKMVRAYLVGEQNTWDENLGCLAGAYNSTPHEATKMSPNLLVLGREIRMPADLLYTHREPDVSMSYVECVLDIQDRMHHAHELARKYLQKSACRSKEIYDSRMLFYEYQVGDAVWCLHETRKVGVSEKLTRAFDGPFLVVEKRSPINFVVKMTKDGQTRLVHHDKLKPYKGTNVPSWIHAARRKL